MNNEKLKRLYMLAERGVGGEKENAKKLLDKLMKKYNINEEQLTSKQVNWYKFSVANDLEAKLLFQTAFKLLGASFGDTPYHRKSKKTHYFELTAEEAIEIEYVFTIYKQDFNKEIDSFYQAFIYKNDIFPDDGFRTNKEDKPMSLEETMKIRNYMNGIEKSNIHKAIETTKSEEV